MGQSGGFTVCPVPDTTAHCAQFLGDIVHHLLRQIETLLLQFLSLFTISG